MVRARFTVRNSESVLYSGEELRIVKLEAAPGDSEENRAFFRRKPSAHICIGLLSPETWKTFELGKEYYVDFTPVE